MGYSIVTSNLFPGDDDTLVKHQEQVYIKLSDEIFVPLIFDKEEEEYYVDTKSDILRKINVDHRKIDDFVKSMGDTTDRITVMVDPEDPEELTDAVTSQRDDAEESEPESESESEPESGPEPVTGDFDPDADDDDMLVDSDDDDVSDQEDQDPEPEPDHHTYRVLSEFMTDGTIGEIFAERGNWKASDSDNVDLFIREGVSHTKDSKLWNVKSQVANAIDPTSSLIQQKNTHRKFVDAALQYMLPEQTAINLRRGGFDPEQYREFIERHGVVILKPVDGWGGNLITVHEDYESFRARMEAIYADKRRDGFAQRKRKEHGFSNRLNWVLEAYLQDPMLYNQRKFHGRVYFIFHVDPSGKKHAYLYDKVRIAVADDPYVAGDWTNKRVHDTHFVLTEAGPKVVYLDEAMPSDAYDHVNDELTALFTSIARNMEGDCYAESEYCYQVFGADIMVTADGSLRLLEINNQPGYNKDLGTAGILLRHIMYHIVDNILPAKNIIRKPHGTGEFIELDLRHSTAIAPAPEPEAEAESEVESLLPDPYHSESESEPDDQELEVAYSTGDEEEDTDDEGAFYILDQDGEEDAAPVNESAFGTTEVVVLEDEDVVLDDEDEDGEDLMEIIVHDTGGVIEQIVRTSYNINRLADLIGTRYEIANDATVERLKTFLLSMVHNHLEQEKFRSLGEKIHSTRQLPSWIVPVVCSTLVVEGGAYGSTAHYHNSHKKGGCYVPFDAPRDFKTRGTLMPLMDDSNSAPGQWEQAGMHHGINVVRQLDKGPNGCELDPNDPTGNVRIQREPGPEYKKQIILTPSMRKLVNNKKGTDRAEEDRSRRMRSGAAFANAVVEPGAIARIETTTREQKKLKVIGFLIIAETGKQFVPLKCNDKEGEEVFYQEATRIIEEHLEQITPETLEGVHNMKPVDEAIHSVFHIDRDDMGAARVREIRDAISAKHPMEVYTQVKDGKIVKQSESEPGKGVRRSWADYHKQRMLGYSSYNARVPDHGLNEDKLVDHGALVNARRTLQYVKKWGPLPGDAVTDPGAFPDTGMVLDNPRAIQYSKGRYYYGHNGKHYLKDDYQQVLRYETRKMLHRASATYPSVDELSDRVRLMSSFHQRQKEECNRRTDRRLANLVIDIAENVPRASMVTAYMNRLMEEDSGLYLEYLSNFTQMGLITYNRRQGRYVTTETSEMIICICHKTYLERGHFIDKEFFEQDGHCKYCMATIRTQEQVVDHSGMIDRDIYLNDPDKEEHNPHVSLEVLFSVILQNLEDFMSQNGWTLSESDQDHILDLLKGDDSIELDPYGAKVRTTSVSAARGDLRALIQQKESDDLKLFASKKKKKSKDIKFSDYTFDKKFRYGDDDKRTVELDLKKLVKNYFKNKFTTSKVSDEALFDPKDREFRKVMQEVAGETSPIDSSVLIMSYFTLPILRDQAINITIVLTHIASFLELKYGTKMSETSYVTEDSNDIAIMLQSHVNTDFIHDVCNEFSELMHSKYQALIHMLHQMGGSTDRIKNYHISMQRLYETVRGGRKSFHPTFTRFYDSYLRIRTTQPFFTYLSRRFESTLKDLRAAQKAQYDSKELGKKIEIVVRNGNLVYNVSTVSLNVDDSPDDLEGYERCVTAARQRVYAPNGYLSELSHVYDDATEALKRTKEDEDEGGISEDQESHEYDMLTAAAHEAQGAELMDITGKDHEIHVPLGVSLEPPETDPCVFLAEELRQIDLKGQAQFHELFHAYDEDPPQKMNEEAHSMLVDRSTQHSDFPDLLQKIIRLQEYFEVFTDEEEDDGVKGIFTADRNTYVHGVIPSRSALVIRETHNERLKKARDLRNIHKYAQAEHTPIPDILGPESDDPDALFPWGEMEFPNMTLRSAAHSQNLGRFLVMLIRWVGTPMTLDQMESMQSRIRAAREGNVWGVNLEFKIEKDHIDSLGYVLEDLFALKKQVSEQREEDTSDEAARQWDYLSHYEELYNISYSEYKAFIAGIEDEVPGLEDPESPEAFLRLITTAIRADIVKHMTYITRGTSRSPLTKVVFTYHPHHKQFVEVLTEMLNVLAAHAGPEIIDPDRNKIDELYELRFREYASKKKIVVPRGKSKQPGININSKYAGEMKTTLDTTVELSVDDEYDPMEAELVEDEEPEDPEPGQFEMLDGVAEAYQGEIEPEYVDEDTLP